MFLKYFRIKEVKFFYFLKASSQNRVQLFLQREIYLLFCITTLKDVSAEKNM